MPKPQIEGKESLIILQILNNIWEKFGLVPKKMLEFCRLKVRFFSWYNSYFVYMHILFDVLQVIFTIELIAKNASSLINHYILTS